MLFVQQSQVMIQLYFAAPYLSLQAQSNNQGQLPTYPIEKWPITSMLWYKIAQLYTQLISFFKKTWDDNEAVLGGDNAKFEGHVNPVAKNKVADWFSQQGGDVYVSDKKVDSFPYWLSSLLPWQLPKQLPLGLWELRQDTE